MSHLIAGKFYDGQEAGCWLHGVNDTFKFHVRGNALERPWNKRQLIPLITPKSEAPIWGEQKVEGFFTPAHL